MRTVEGANIGLLLSFRYAYIFCIISCCFGSPERPVVGGQAGRVVVASLTSWGTLEAQEHLVQRTYILLSLQPRSCNTKPFFYTEWLQIRGLFGGLLITYREILFATNESQKYKFLPA